MSVERIVAWIRTKYQGLTSDLDERSRRRWAAVEAVSLGRGGISAVSAATGIARSTIRRGIGELNRGQSWEAGRQRGPGGGRKRAEQVDPRLRSALEQMVEPESRGDPQSPLRWTCKSTRTLAKELARRGHRVSAPTVARLLHDADYSLQANRKTREGKDHPDRDAQFRYLNCRVAAQQSAGQPCISVDTKKKENVGNRKNPGRTWRRKGQPLEVDVHDFPDPALPKAVPHGVYDLKRNEGWVSVGISSDTAEFAVASIGQWWKRLGRRRYPDAKRLLITADSGGSNGHRNRLWKLELQKLSNRFGLEIEVCHFPPGTSKWNKIEHRLFCHITSNWRGEPLVSDEVVVSLIGSTTTETGLRVYATLDRTKYEKGRKVSAKEFAKIHPIPSHFHGEWNYTIKPRR